MKTFLRILEKFLIKICMIFGIINNKEYTIRVIKNF